MSTLVMSACWPLQMPPTPKAVLISLADNANDHGECWPSIPHICMRTCFGKTAVIAAIQWLEQAGAVSANRDNGRHTTYTVHPDRYVNPSASQTGPADEPVRQAIHTSPAGGVDPSGRRSLPVREADSNRNKPSRTVSKATVSKSAPTSSVAKPDDVQAETWADWLHLRKAKKAPVTGTVLAHAITEAEKAGMPLERFLGIWCARGSQGLEASWLKPHERAGPRPSPSDPNRPSAAADFRGKNYGTTDIDRLPPDLRDAARAALD